jgi:hypothetical protein
VVRFRRDVLREREARRPDDPRRALALERERDPFARERDPVDRERESDERRVRVSPARRRCLLTVRAAISSARSLLRPRRFADDLMCSYCLCRFLLTPRIGIVASSFTPPRNSGGTIESSKSSATQSRYR